MIKRYSVKEIEELWTDQNKFDAFLKVEIVSAQAWSQLGIVPKEDLTKINDKASFDLERIYEIEKETKHDVVAFTRAVSETLGEERKWIHYGLTSTDVVDTANGFILKQVNDIIETKILDIMETIKQQAYRFKDTPTIGRTHGVHADVTSFGLKWALWYDEMNRNLERFRQARNEVEIGKISGAVGNFANTSPFIQDFVCKELGINSANISTQVLQRDRHANYLFVISLIGSTISKMALEVRSLQRTEVREVFEFFDKNQKGSSAMPHKKNPIASENVTGLARVLKGYVFPALEDIQLWHERDISHSSVERIILPDATNLITYMLNRYNNVLKNIIIDEERMIENISSTNNVIFSQQVLNVLIKEKQLTREVAYDQVQKLALQSWNERIDFKELITEEFVVKQKVLTNEDIENIFDLKNFLKSTDEIFERVFK